VLGSGSRCSEHWTLVLLARNQQFVVGLYALGVPAGDEALV
jgi:hypothetical protein